MTIKIHLLCIFSLVNAILMNSQEQPFGSLANAQSARDELGIAMAGGMKNAYAFGSKYKGVLGSPFLANDWQKATICLARDSVIVDSPDLLVKFDIYSNELWVMHKRDSTIINSKVINWFSIEGYETTSYYKYPKAQTAKPDLFYEKIYDHKGLVLIKQNIKKLVKADFVDKGMYTTGQPYDRFEEKSEYLFSISGEEFSEIKLNTKDFGKVIEKRHKKSLSEFLDQQNLKGKLSEEESVIILDYLSSLQ